MFAVSSYQEILSQDPINKETVDSTLSNVLPNIHYVFEILHQNHLILTSSKRFSIKKINALYITRLLLQSCSFQCVTLIQVYLLPTIQKIANIHHNEPTDYKIFKSQNKTKSSEAIIAMDIIMMGESIKPFQMFETHELLQPSNYAKSLSKMKQQLPLNHNISANNLRNKFKDNLASFHLNHTHYVNYFIDKGLALILNGTEHKESMTILPLLKENCGYINSQVLGLIVEYLESGTQIDHRGSALLLLGQLVLWADIESILMINYSTVIQHIADQIQKQIANVNKFKSHKKLKFIKDFLWHLQLWAQLMPYDNFIDKEVTDRSSLIYNIYMKSSKNPKLQFPKIPRLDQLKSEFNQNMKTNICRNNKIIKEIYTNHNYVEPSQFSLFGSENLNYLKLKEKIKMVSSLMKSQKLNESEMEPICDRINHESLEIQNYLQLIDQMSDEPKKDKFQLEGQECLEKIRIFNNLNNKRKKQKITFQEFIKEVRTFIKPVDNFRSMSDSANSRKPFFDSSSEQSINSIKTFVYRKYHKNYNFQPKNKYFLTKPSNQQYQINYQKLIADEQDIIQPMYEPSIHSYHTSFQEKQKLLAKPNPSFEDCSKIDQILIPIERRQVRYIFNTTNETFKINSPSRYKNSKTKSKNKQILEKFMNSEEKVKEKSKPKRKNIFPQKIENFKQKYSSSSSSKYGNGQLVEVERKNKLSEYDEKTKKKLLKDKTRVFKSENIEIGSQVERQGSCLTIVYFLTPYKTITMFECECEQSSELEITIHPLEESQLQANKQYKIYFQVRMLQFVYALPRIKFKYQWQQNEHGYQSCLTLLPALPLKFIQHQQLQPTQIERQFMNRPSKRCGQIQLQNSILRNNQTIQKYIPNLVLLEERIYGTHCTYQKWNFMVKFIIRGEVMWAEGISLDGGEEILCNYLRMVRELFELDN